MTLNLPFYALRSKSEELTELLHQEEFKKKLLRANLSLDLQIIENISLENRKLMAEIFFENLSNNMSYNEILSFSRNMDILFPEKELAIRQMYMQNAYALLTQNSNADIFLTYKPKNKLEEKRLCAIFEAMPEAGLQKIINESPSQFSSILLMSIPHSQKLLQRVLPTLPPQILIEKNSMGWNAVMLASRYQPELLASLLNRIPNKEAVWTARNLKGQNLLLIIAKYQPSYLLSLIDTIPSAVLKEVWMASDREDYNVLYHIAIKMPKLLPSVAEAIPQEFRRELWLQRQQEKISQINILMFASNGMDSTSVQFLLESINRLPPSLKNEIWTAIGTLECNALMLAAKFSTTLFPLFIDAIPDEIKVKLWRKKTSSLSSNYGPLNALQLAALPNYVEKLPDIMTALRKGESAAYLTQNQLNSFLRFTQYNLFTQLEILRNVSGFQNYKKELLKDALNTLKDSSPIEHAIKESLLSMWYNASNKQAKVIDAVNDIKQLSMGNSEINLKKALQDPSSALYKALQTRRYSFFIPLSKQTSSLKEALYASAIKEKEDSETCSAPKHHPK